MNIILVLLVLWLIFGHPHFGQRIYPGYGYYGGGLGTILVIILVPWVLGVFR